MTRFSLGSMIDDVNFIIIHEQWDKRKKKGPSGNNELVRTCPLKNVHGHHDKITEETIMARLIVKRTQWIIEKSTRSLMITNAHLTFIAGQLHPSLPVRPVRPFCSFNYIFVRLVSCSLLSLITVSFEYSLSLCVCVSTD